MRAEALPSTRTPLRAKGEQSARSGSGPLIAKPRRTTSRAAAVIRTRWPESAITGGAWITAASACWDCTVTPLLPAPMVTCSG
jgi:hypothetical protein